MNHIPRCRTDITWRGSICRANLGCISLPFNWLSVILGPVDIKTRVLISESPKVTEEHGD